MPQPRTRSHMRLILSGTLSILIMSGCLPTPSQVPSSTRNAEVTLSGKTKISTLAPGGEQDSGLDVSSDASPEPVKPPVVTAAEAIGGIRGTVWVPPGIVSTNGGSIISHNGGNIISSNGGSIIGNNGGSIISHNGGSIISHNGGSLRAQQVPLANTVVRLVDAAGAPVLHEGKAVVATTDAEGHYAFPVTVEGRNLVVKAEVPGQNGELVSLLPREGLAEGEKVDVDISSTLMLEYVLSQYVKGDVAVFEKLPKDIAEKARVLVEEAIAERKIALPETLEKQAIVEKVAEVRGADQAVDQVFEEIKRLLIVVGIRNHGDGMPATTINIPLIAGVTHDASGNLYVFSHRNHTLWKLTPDGILHTLVAKGNWGYPEQEVTITNPAYLAGMAFDSAGNLLLADSYYQRVVSISKDRQVTVVAGNGTAGFSGDGGPASRAQIHHPSGLAVDAKGHIWVSDSENHRIRQIQLDGTIKTVVGDGTAGYAGDGGPAIDARLNRPKGLALRSTGELLIADYENHRVRSVDASGKIATLAERTTRFVYPGAIAVDDHDRVTVLSHWTGDLFKLDSGGVSFIDRSVIQGDGIKLADVDFTLVLDAIGDRLVTDDGMSRLVGFGPDGQITRLIGAEGESLAQASRFRYATGMAINQQGTIFVADLAGKNVVKARTDGSVEPVAGNGEDGFTKDSSEPLNVPIGMPFGMAINNDGDLVFCNIGNHPTIKKLDKAGKLTTLAGNGEFNYMVDPVGEALKVALANPISIVQATDGSYLVGEPDVPRLLQISAEGKVSVLAKGDRLQYPGRIAIDTDGRIFIAEMKGGKIVVLENGDFATVFDRQFLLPYLSLEELTAMVLDSGNRMYLATKDRVIRVEGQNVTRVAGVGGRYLNGATQDDGVHAISALALSRAGDLYILEHTQLKRLTKEQLDSK